MATLRKANAYSKRKVVPYTRASKKKAKSYIKTVPHSKIVKFDNGDVIGFQQGKYPYKLTLVSTEKVQIRNNALEACRIYLNKKLDKETNKQYYFKVVPYPHHIQRENKMLTGAGADRMQTGMQLSFGKTVNKAAIVKPGKAIFILAVPTLKNSIFAKQELRKIKSKLPCKTRVISEEIKK